MKQQLDRPQASITKSLIRWTASTQKNCVHTGYWTLTNRIGFSVKLGPSCTNVVQIWVDDRASQVPEPLSLNDQAVNFFFLQGRKVGWPTTPFERFLLSISIINLIAFCQECRSLICSFNHYLFRFIIHKIFSLARDWSKHITWPNIL